MVWNLIFLVCTASALRFHVPANDGRCLKEEIHKDVVVTGEYEFSEGIGYTGSVLVCILLSCFFYKCYRSLTQEVIRYIKEKISTISKENLLLPQINTTSLKFVLRIMLPMVCFSFLPTRIYCFAKNIVFRTFEPA